MIYLNILTNLIYVNKIIFKKILYLFIISNFK